MRILLVGRSLPFHHIGGMEAVAWDLARELARVGHQTTILTTRIEARPEHSEADGVALHALPHARPGRYSLAWWTGSRKAYRDLYRERVDVVMGVGAGAYGLIDARPRSGGPAFVMQVHGTSWSEFKSKWAVPRPRSWATSGKNVGFYFKDRRYRRFDRLVAIGDAVEHQLREAPTRWMVGRTPVTTIPNGVSEADFAFDAKVREAVRAGLGLDSDARVVISAGRLHVQKGIDLGLQGFAEARKAEPRLRFVIAGAGPDGDRLEALVAEMGLGEAVMFVGPKTRTELARLYSAADVFMLNSVRTEGLPVAPLEAMAAGLPCVLSPHIADPAFDALAAPPREPTAVARAISQAIAEVGARGRVSRLPEQFTLRRAAARYVEVFEAARGRAA